MRTVRDLPHPPRHRYAGGEGNGSLAHGLKEGESWWALQGPKLKGHLFALQVHLFNL